MATLDATVGGPDANAYLPVAEADGVALHRAWTLLLGWQRQPLSKPRLSCGAQR